MESCDLEPAIIVMRIPPARGNTTMSYIIQLCLICNDKKLKRPKLNF
jgi:hypothetical protein